MHNVENPRFPVCKCDIIGVPQKLKGFYGGRSSMVECCSVEADVAGSIPVGHPITP